MIRETHFNLSQCCHQSMLRKWRDGGRSNEGACRLDEGQRAGGRGNDSILQTGSSVYSVHTDCLCVCVTMYGFVYICPDFHQLRGTLSTGLSLQISQSVSPFLTFLPFGSRSDYPSV